MPNRPTRAWIDFRNWKGLSTKAVSVALDPSQLTIAQNVDYFNKYGGAAKCKGSSRVLSSQYKEGGSAKNLSWIGFYKFLELNGEQLRKTLIAAGTTIQLVNSGGGLTSLKTGRTDSLVHADDRLGRFLLISNQNPLLIGNGDEPVKFDGHEISTWGLRTPGNDVTVLDSFDDANSWVADSGAPNTAIADETTTTRDGNSIKVTQGSGDSRSDIAKLLSSFSASTKQADRVQVSLYLDPDTFDNIRTTNDAIRVFFSSDGSLPISNNYYRFDFDIGDLGPGWNTLKFDFTSAPTGDNGTSVGTLNTNTIQTVQVQIFGADTSSAVVAYWDRLVNLSIGIPTGVLTDTSGSVFSNDATTGRYKYVVTFRSKHGHESNAGDALTVDNRGGSDTYASIELSDVPVSSDSQTILRRIYRTVGGGSKFLLVATIADNTTTDYSDTTADASLGTDTPPLAASVTKDNSVPPRGGIVKVWKRTCFVAGDPENPSLLYFSRDDKPEAFPLINFFDLESRITGIFDTALGLVVTTERTYWRVLGNNPNFDVEKVVIGVGALGARTVGMSRHVGWAMDEDGLRLYDLQQVPNISETIRDKFDAIARATITESHTEHLTKDNAIFVFNKDSNGEYKDNFVWQYAGDSVNQGQWSTLDIPVDILDIREIEDSNGDTKLYGGSADGQLFEIWANGTTQWATVSGSSNIETILEHPYIRPGAILQGAEYRGRCLPLWVEVQAEGDATTWAITLEMSEGPNSRTAKDSQTINCTFGANNTLIRESVRVQQGASNENNLHPFEYFRLTAKNTDNAASVLLNIRVWFDFRPGQFMVNTVDNS